MQMQLSKDEQDEYNKIKQNQLNPTEEETAALCLKYYVAYRENQNIVGDKISLAFKCAYFMAEKSQFSYNLKGEKVRGISFSLNQLLKDHKLDDTMFMLKQMTKKIKDIDEDTNTYLNNIVKEISFLITLHSKFEKTFSQKLQLKQKINEGGSYAKLFTSFAWLLFIIVKNEVLKRSLELLPNTCMVAHIISSMLILAWDYIKPEALIRVDKRLNEGGLTKEIKRVIKEKVLEIFCIKDLAQYSKIAKSFEDYLYQMTNTILKTTEDKLDILSPEHIQFNYRKLDKYYENRLTIENLDERIFFKERAMNLTPSKFTPFARQGYANKYQKQPIGNKLGGMAKPSKQQTFNSHRVLNYEAIERQIQTKSVPIHDIKLPKNIIQSPSMVKIPLLTPISTGMEMYNYLNEKRKRIREIHPQERSIDKNLITLMNQVFNLHYSENERLNKQNKEDLIVSLYKIFSEEYLAANSYEKDTPELMRAFLGLSMQLVFFVSNISLSFEKIEEELQIQPFEMWKAIDYFLKSDKSIPFPIKLHFLDLQVNFVSFKIWQSMQMVIKISTFSNKSLKQASQYEINFIDKLFKRTVHQVAFQITRLTTLLQIDEQSSQRVFEIMKQILTTYPELLYKRHMDQLIICSIYASCKGVYKIMFNDIKECYMMSNPNLKDIIEDIIVHVYMSEEEPPNDIITFYNQMFLKFDKLKDFISNLRSNSSSTTALNNVASKNNKKNTLLMSPMKAIIPKDIPFKSKTNAVNNANVKGKNNNMTPQTQLLFAYNESPILKYEVNTFKGPLKSKKVLHYEDEEEKMKNRSYEEEMPIYSNKPTPSDNNISPHMNMNNYQATNDYITKKYARKTTTPVQQQGMIPPTQCIQTMQHTYQPQMQLQIPLQNITKENINAPHSSNSHRTLFEDKKQAYQSQVDQTKYKTKNYQMANYRRE